MSVFQDFWQALSIPRGAYTGGAGGALRRGAEGARSALKCKKIL